MLTITSWCRAARAFVTVAPLSWLATIPATTSVALVIIPITCAIFRISKTTVWATVTASDSSSGHERVLWFVVAEEFLTL